MDTIERLLQLLALLAARPWWTGPELAERLETTERTIRRDVTRLRTAGYPVVAVSGPAGGYRLGSGTRLPPLVFDDDEAVAVALGLRTAAAGGADHGTAALRALAKLDQVLPTSVREQLAALGAVTVGLRGGTVPSGSPDALVRLAVACRRSERIRYSYRTAAGEESSRSVEPYRLVFTERAWYLVAFDLDRQDWRTFRVDRMTDLRQTSVRFRPHPDPPDAAVQVATGIAVAGWDVQATVRLFATHEEMVPRVAPTDGRLVPDAERPAGGPPTVLLHIGGDEEWIARYLAGLPCSFEVLEPESVRVAVGELARRLLVHHPAPPEPVV